MAAPFYARIGSRCQMLQGDPAALCAARAWPTLALSALGVNDWLRALPFAAAPL